MFRKSLLAGAFLLSLGAHADNCRTEMLDYQGYLRLVITQSQPDWNDPYCTYGYRQCVASIRLNPNLEPSCRVVPLDIYGNPMYSYEPSYECTTTTTTYYDDGTSRTRTTHAPCGSERGETRTDDRPDPRPNPRPHWNPGTGGNSGGTHTPNPRPHWNPGNGGTSTNPGTNTSTNNGSNSNTLPPSGSSGGTIHPPRPIPENASGLVEIKPRIEVDTKALLKNNILMSNGKEYQAEIFDGQRSIENGETVIMAGNTFTVVSSKASSYLIKPEGNHKETVNVSRSQIAITRGCSYSICVTDAIYNLLSSRVEAVVGLTTEGDLITKAQGESINPNPVKLGNIAPAKGCSSNRSLQPICVGNTVQLSDGRFMEILAIQLDGAVVGRMNADRNYSAAVFANINPAEMVVVN
jgi:hypothetical protein